jgi:hypothetical protein
MQMRPYFPLTFLLRGQQAAGIDAPLQIQAALSAAILIRIPFAAPSDGKLRAPGGHTYR